MMHTTITAVMSRKAFCCPITTLRVDGGASVSDIMMQTQADLLRLPVDRPAQVETTAFGAAALAGLAAGVWGSLEEVAALRRSQHVFLPQRPQAACEAQPGTMAAILGLEDKVVEEICASVDGVVVAANYNCPGQLVISAHKRA